MENVNNFLTANISDKDIKKWFKGIYSRRLRSLVKQAESTYHVKIEHIEVYENGVVKAIH